MYRLRFCTFRRKVTLTLLLALLCAFGVMHSLRAAQADSPVDTSLTKAGKPRVYALDGVEVTAARLPQAVLHSPSPVSVLSRTDVEGTGGTSLAQVLSIQPGLFIKDYGGPSALKTLSQRGLGAEHTLLLLNGIPVNSVQTGFFDLGGISAGEIERVEVVRGGHSASFGANAVAGVINVVAREPDHNHTVEARVGGGPWGYRIAGASVGDVDSTLQWRVSLSHEQEKGDFPFRYSNGTSFIPLIRQNSDFTSLTGTGSMRLRISPATQGQAYVSAWSGERGVPGPVAGPVSIRRARQRDWQFIMQSRVLTTPTDRLALEGHLQVQHSNQRYTDPDLVVNFLPLDNTYANTEVRADAKTDLRIGDAVRLCAGGDAAHAWVEGNTVGAVVRRTHWGAYLLGEQQIGPGSNGMNLSVFPALRFDQMSENVHAVSPQLGLLFTLPIGPLLFAGNCDLRVRGSISRNFRAPTFNELYYNGGGGRGNPDLTPERSTGGEFGLGLSFLAGGEHHADVTLFENDMTDRIVWVAAGPGVVMPKNLRHVLSRGIELTYLWALTPAGWSLSVHYVLMRSEKVSPDFEGDTQLNMQLVYLPEEEAGVTASHAIVFEQGILRSVRLSAGLAYTGFRYATEDNASTLPAHTLLRVGCEGNVLLLGGDLKVRLDVQNVFDQEYEVMPGYPMPPRSLRLSMSVSY